MKTGTPRPWPENTAPTPEQLADWLAVCDRDELVLFAAAALNAQSQASLCFLQHSWRHPR